MTWDIQQVFSQKVKVTGSQSAKTYWGRLSGRREFAPLSSADRRVQRVSNVHTNKTTWNIKSKLQLQTVASGALKMQNLMQDMKMTDQIVGHDFAGTSVAKGGTEGKCHP